MGFPVTATLTLTYPPDEGLPPNTLPFTATMTVEHRSVQRLRLKGAGAKVVDFGTTEGGRVKLLVIAVEAKTGATPILCRYNGSELGAVEISPGGYGCIVSPNPVAGITALTVVHTTDVDVRVWLFG